MILEKILNKNEGRFNNLQFKQSMGQLKTDINLVREMVDKIPEDVIISDDTKFLDPCAGTGTFIVCLLERLLKYKSFDKAIKQLYACDSTLTLFNAFLKDFVPIENPLSDIKNEFFDILLSEISNGEIKTLSEISYIIYNENIKNEITGMRLMLMEFIERYERVSKLESKLFGEVFTPKKLIEEMVNHLPKECWSDKNLKWLDPAVGIGNFPSVIVEKLMEGLKDEIPVDSDRYKWIMEEMIYMCDISSKNLFLLYKLFDEHNKLKLNVYRGSFLSDDFDKHMKEVWGLDGFDVIVGNPPYNENNSNNDEKLYFKFIKKSFNLLFDDKFLLYVVPDDSINYILKNEKYNIILLNTNDISGRFFKGIGTKIVYFLSNKRIDIDNETTFIDKYSQKNINLNNKSIILMSINDTLLVDKILKKSNDRFEIKNAKYKGNNFRIRFNSIRETRFNLRGINFICVDRKLLNKHSLEASDFERDIFKYGVIDHSTDRIEFYADSNFDNNNKRICINAIGEMKAIYDEFGDLLLTDSCVYIEPGKNENPNNYLQLINNSKLVKFLQKVITHNTKNKYKSLNYLPYLDLSKSWTDVDLYNYFNLTQEEINLIEKTIKD